MGEGYIHRVTVNYFGSLRRFYTEYYGNAARIVSFWENTGAYVCWSKYELESEIVRAKGDW